MCGKGEGGRCTTTSSPRGGVSGDGAKCFAPNEMASEKEPLSGGASTEIPQPPAIKTCYGFSYFFSESRLHYVPPGLLKDPFPLSVKSSIVTCPESLLVPYNKSDATRRHRQMFAPPSPSSPTLPFSLGVSTFVEAPYSLPSQQYAWGREETSSSSSAAAAASRRGQPPTPI